MKTGGKGGGGNLWKSDSPLDLQRRRNKGGGERGQRVDTGEAHQGSSGGAPGDWEPLIKHLIKEMVTRCVVVTLALPGKKIIMNENE